MQAYGKRKEFLLANLRAKLLKLSNKARYIQSVLDDVIDLRRKTAQQVYDLLKSLEFAEIDGDYKYLIKMPMDSVSAENVDSILKDKETTEMEYNTLLATTESDMWLKELEVFETKYQTYKTRRMSIQQNSGDNNHTSSSKKKIAVKKVISPKLKV